MMRKGSINALFTDKELERTNQIFQDITFPNLQYLEMYLDANLPTIRLSMLNAHAVPKLRLSWVDKSGSLDRPQVPEKDYEFDWLDDLVTLEKLTNFEMNQERLPYVEKISYFDEELRGEWLPKARQRLHWVCFEFKTSLEMNGDYLED
ncbi:hypothetical protein N7462_006189 [Penicillium macrosclerotiorum]|uniref:uncharacterized protein n=1 Tax=Penicillium macrosclerotiorum TaxID=303699 RepID=UPI0025499B02|nr:uncharacterized protein N7462_006189 [Penicillium macrosclerotiorum]KAJ5683024.1 hypothetical protein N7462_006189 [Penicillium macrosclerotiorum]